jgi:hypothetical protein
MSLKQDASVASGQAEKRLARRITTTIRSFNDEYQSENDPQFQRPVDAGRAGVHDQHGLRATGDGREED